MQTSLLFNPFEKNNILDDRLSPILKWAGGKEQELKYIHPAMPKEFNNYYEPFIGGGAVYFSIKANKLFINDKSYELIDLYNAIKYEDRLFFQMMEEITSNWKKLEDFVYKNSKFIINLYSDFSNNRVNEVDMKAFVSEFISNNLKLFNKMLEPNFTLNPDNFIKELKKNLFNKIKRMKKIEADRGLLPHQDILDNIESALKSAFYMYLRHLYNNIKKYNINKSQEVSLFFFIRNFAYSGMFRYNKSGEFNVPYGGINAIKLSQKALEL